MSEQTSPVAVTSQRAEVPRQSVGGGKFLQERAYTRSPLLKIIALKGELTFGDLFQESGLVCAMCFARRRFTKHPPLQPLHIKYFRVDTAGCSRAARRDERRQRTIPTQDPTTDLEAQIHLTQCIN